MSAPPLRRHQRLALDSLAGHWEDGHTRAWVELPPGAGKTRVALESGRALLDAGAVTRVVALGPNTAIQGQWLDQAAAHGFDTGSDRTLCAELTALTYQSLAVFDADAEVDDDPTTDGGPRRVLSRLHDNGRALVTALAEAGDILVVLDECHHLLEVWGQLLGEVLEAVPRARVLGLTATPPESLTRAQATLVDDLFGQVVHASSIPAVVREGDLAPFAELAWLVTPTGSEREWLDAGAERFAELTTALLDPTYGEIGFLAWLDARFAADDVSWTEVRAREPEAADAALRMAHAGLLAPPPGARAEERHRHAPTADDWVLLLEDWLLRHVGGTGRAEDERLIEAVRRVLPAVGHAWTRRGIRRGRSTVDRVLARSEAKTTATVQIVAAEAATLGDRLRMLVLCDHERAGATLPVDLEGVLDAQSGSAHRVLVALLADPGTAALAPLLVTGRTVAGSSETVQSLRAAVAVEDPELAAGLVLEDRGDSVVALAGGWSSRTWVRHVTRFFEAGGTQVLVGTRALLGEGWDARRVSGLVDLTTVTTSTAVVQTRGRALRVDPTWPAKVALTWTVVCVAPDHPRGDNDWLRLVRKHDGFFGVDDDGDVVDGVAHLDAAFSPFEPPPAAHFDAVNARMVARSQERDAIRERWRVGTPYDDRVARTLRLRALRPHLLGESTAPPAVLVVPSGAEVREVPVPTSPWPSRLLALAVTAGVLGVLASFGSSGSGVLLCLAVVAGALLGRARLRRALRVRHGRAVVAAASEPPSLARLASAVADGLAAAGLVSRSADHVDVALDREGVHRCVLRGVTEAESAVFVAALDEVVSPLLEPRYLVPRWVVSGGEVSEERALAVAAGSLLPDGVVWHAVPAVAGRNRRLADAYARGWSAWVSGGAAVAATSPEGAGALAAQAGADPLQLSTLVRSHWM